MFSKHRLYKNNGFVNTGCVFRWFGAYCVCKTSINVTLLFRNIALTNDFWSQSCSGGETEKVDFTNIYNSLRFSIVLFQRLEPLINLPKLLRGLKMMESLIRKPLSKLRLRWFGNKIWNISEKPTIVRGFEQIEAMGIILKIKLH